MKVEQLMKTTGVFLRVRVRNRRTRQGHRCRSAGKRIRGGGPLFTTRALGGWISRDPAAEDGGINLYCTAVNNPFSFIDPLGLKTITFVVVRDATLKGNYWNTKVEEQIKTQKQTLIKVLEKCNGGCENTDIPGVEIDYKSKSVVTAPSDKIWDFGIAYADLDGTLLATDFAGVNKLGTGIPVIWTLENIRSHGSGGTQDAAGYGRLGKGILLSWASLNLFMENVLAHELGHYAGYSGGDLNHGGHSSDPNNIMAQGKNGIEPDADWCEKVLLLAK